MKLNLLIEEAASIAGSQKALAEKLGIFPHHLSEMKANRRPCSLKTRAKIAEIAGYSVQHALIEGVIEELDHEDETQKKAAEGLEAILTAFPDNSWRKR